VTGLEQNEVKAYIQHHLAIAGRTDPLFTDEVITEIYHHAKGLPRVINTLCYDCLWEIYELQKNLVDLPTLERVLCRYDETGLPFQRGLILFHCLLQNLGAGLK
jgi:type II secretory pathway predicted ATPase ExeA